MYRLYVIYTENNKKPSDSDDIEIQSNISIISRSDLTYVPKRPKRPSSRQRQNESFKRPLKNARRNTEEDCQSSDTEGSEHGSLRNNQ